MRFLVERSHPQVANFSDILLSGYAVNKESNATNDAQNWRRAMAHIMSVLGRPVILGRERSPRRVHCRTRSGYDLGDDAGGHRGPDDVVSAVALAPDAMEGLDADGVGSMDRRIQFGAAGNAVGDGLTSCDQDCRRHRCWYHQQEQRDSRLIPPRSCPTDRVHLRVCRLLQ